MSRASEMLIRRCARDHPSNNISHSRNAKLTGGHDRNGAPEGSRLVLKAESSAIAVAGPRTRFVGPKHSRGPLDSSRSDGLRSVYASSQFEVGLLLDRPNAMHASRTSARSASRSLYLQNGTQVREARSERIISVTYPLGASGGPATAGLTVCSVLSPVQPTCTGDGAPPLSSGTVCAFRLRGPGAGSVMTLRRWSGCTWHFQLVTYTRVRSVGYGSHVGYCDTLVL
ncbi:hypothetical protein OH77DRAFT_1426357 [Trametes cingulata]|nr:hypothetical protein OH77DRAFT_1426357 [Trametes cingulata]